MEENCRSRVGERRARIDLVLNGEDDVKNNRIRANRTIGSHNLMRVKLRSRHAEVP